MDEIEDSVSLREFARTMGFSDSKVRRLINHGCEAVDGRIVRLESFITEAGRRTSIDSYRRFLVALNKTKEELNEQESATRDNA